MPVSQPDGKTDFKALQYWIQELLDKSVFSQTAGLGSICAEVLLDPSDLQ